MRLHWALRFRISSLAKFGRSTRAAKIGPKKSQCCVVAGTMYIDIVSSSDVMSSSDILSSSCKKYSALCPLALMLSWTNCVNLLNPLQSSSTSCSIFVLSPVSVRQLQTTAVVTILHGVCAKNFSKPWRQIWVNRLWYASQLRQFVVSGEDQKSQNVQSRGSLTIWDEILS